MNDTLVLHVLQTLAHGPCDSFELVGLKHWLSLSTEQLHVFVQVEVETLERDHDVLAKLEAVKVLYDAVASLVVVLVTLL